MPRPAIRLRATRATPPNLAADEPERRETVGAALEQAEEFFDAAAVVRAVARPVPLFYAMSQGTRAISAAWADDDWRSDSHGLTQDRSTTAWRSGDVLHFRVRPARKPGVFGSLASTFDLPALTDSVELGALWAAIPGMSAPGDGGWRLGLPVWPQLYMQEGGFVLHLGAPHRGYVVLRGQAPENDAEAINGLLADYPDAAGAHVEVAQTIIQAKQTPWGIGVPVRWPEPEWDSSPEGPPPPEVVASQVHNRVPEYRHRREHWLVPRVGAGRDELPPLLLWWVLLFGLSLLARYEPAAWRRALDPDESELAVPLEELLEEALNIAPLLLHEAITRQPDVLPPR